MEGFQELYERSVLLEPGLSSNNDTPKNKRNWFKRWSCLNLIEAWANKVLWSGWLATFQFLWFCSTISGFCGVFQAFLVLVWLSTVRRIWNCRNCTQYIENNPRVYSSTELFLSYIQSLCSHENNLDLLSRKHFFVSCHFQLHFDFTTKKYELTSFILVV